VNDQQMIDKVAVLLDPVTPPPHLRSDVAAAIAAVSSERTSRTWRWRLSTVGAVAAAAAAALLVGQVVSLNHRQPVGTAQAAEILYRAGEVARADQTPAPRDDQFISDRDETCRAWRVRVVGDPNVDVCRRYARQCDLDQQPVARRTAENGAPGLP
jgi:hypothetical protein